MAKASRRAHKARTLVKDGHWQVPEHERPAEWNKILDDDPTEEQKLQHVVDSIQERGWRKSAEFITADLWFITDLCIAGHLTPLELFTFARDTEVTLNILFARREAPFEEEARRLTEAVQAFNGAYGSHLASAPSNSPSTEKRLWSLTKAFYVRDYLDETLQFCEACSYSWRVHLQTIPVGQGQVALKNIEELERRIPLLRSGRLADLPVQLRTVDQCMLLNTALVAFVGDGPSLRKLSDHIVKNRKMWSSFVEALVGPAWLQAASPRAYLKKISHRIYYQEAQPDLERDSQGVRHRQGNGGRKIGKKDVLDRLYRAGFTGTRPTDPPPSPEELEFDHAAYRAAARKYNPEVDDPEAGNGNPEDETSRSEQIRMQVMCDLPNEASAESRFTERSIAELETRIRNDEVLRKYYDTLRRNPRWKRPEVWNYLGLTEKEGQAVDRRLRNAQRRVKALHAGMEIRAIPPRPGISEASLNMYFEVLAEGTKGAKFGTYQHKPLITGEK